MADADPAGPGARAPGIGRDLVFRDFGVRAASGVVMAVGAGTALWLGGWFWLGLVALVALGVFIEWSRLVLGFVRSLPGRVAWLLAGIGYIGGSALTLAILREPMFGFRPIVSLLVTVVGIDVGAYLAGRFIGGPKLAPSISPSKTWAGLGGAVLVATLIMVEFWPHDWSYAAMAPLLAVVAQAGDFFESWMKRRAGVKDSGALIPGHGGLFDRVDGLLAVAFVMGLVRLVTTLAANG